MPEGGANGEGAGEVKVVDRRRFTPDGAAREDAAAPGGEAGDEAGAAQAHVADDRDARLAAAEARVDELLRAYAAQVEEAKAQRARLERERQRVLEAERANVAQALLESMDELDRALAAAGTPEPGTALAALVEGVRLGLASLAKRVADMGAERIPVLGAPFDPRVAEAIDLVPTADPAQDQLVVEEIRPGWRVGERVLRPARVRVARAVRA
jgi:molecular chaperone GrpE